MRLILKLIAAPLTLFLTVLVAVLLFLFSLSSFLLTAVSGIMALLGVGLFWLLLGGLLYPVHIFGMEFEICQQGLALLALLPIWLYRGRQGYHSKPFQYACYAFYPVHMLILVLILQYLTR